MVGNDGGSRCGVQVLGHTARQSACRSLARCCTALKTEPADSKQRKHLHPFCHAVEYVQHGGGRRLPTSEDEHGPRIKGRQQPHGLQEESKPRDPQAEPHSAWRPSNPKQDQAHQAQDQLDSVQRSKHVASHIKSDRQRDTGRGKLYWRFQKRDTKHQPGPDQCEHAKQAQRSSRNVCSHNAGLMYQVWLV